RIILVSLQPGGLGPGSSLLARAAAPDLLLTPSPALLENAESRGIHAAALPLGVDQQRFAPVDSARKAALREKHDLPPDERIVLHVGHASGLRGLDWLVELASRPGVLPLLVIGRSLGVDPSVLDR